MDKSLYIVEGEGPLSFMFGPTRGVQYAVDAETARTNYITQHEEDSVDPLGGSIPGDGKGTWEVLQVIDLSLAENTDYFEEIEENEVQHAWDGEASTYVLIAEVR